MIARHSIAYRFTRPVALAPGAGWVCRGFVAAEGGAGFDHVTVLRDEAVAALAPSEGKTIADLTVGGGGHSEALLEAGASVLGLDRDRTALVAAQRRLARFGERFEAVHGNFASFDALMRERGAEPFDGILLDLGVSSPQLDLADRGFSFLREGPLDMRMDASGTQPTAADLVNEAAEEELVDLFRRFGEEPQARRAARAICTARAHKPITTTTELAALIESTLGRRGGKHPATRVFQALRIAVNGELDALSAVLEASVEWLKPGGVLAVISFHSLEDRMVKRFLRETSATSLDRPEWPQPKPNPRHFFTQATRRSIAPTAAEIDANPRARSARLRVAERRCDS